MKLSLRGEYALRALIALGDSFDNDVVPMQIVANHQEIPKRFLEQILNDLRSGGFVESKRGIAGGYRLARPMQEITLAEVIRHIEGTLAPITNVNRRSFKLNPQAAGTELAIRAIMKEVRNALMKVLDEVSIADLYERARQLQSDPTLPNDYTI